MLVVHCKAGKGRTGTMVRRARVVVSRLPNDVACSQIACLLVDRYASDQVTALDALSFYAKQRSVWRRRRRAPLMCRRNRTFNHKGVTIASQNRYVRYYESLVAQIP